MQNFKMLTNLLLGERAKKKKERKKESEMTPSIIDNLLAWLAHALCSDQFRVLCTLNYRSCRWPAVASKRGLATLVSLLCGEHLLVRV